MEWQIIIALVIAIPVIVLPAAFVWYLNIGGIVSAIHESREKRATHQNETRKTGEIRRHADYHGWSLVGRRH
ncbi:MAG: hypothetical protein JW712_01090 [Dehalococcoidales bacterium]|nr:hypothetical protein [Dehalococcoidales bacterium]